MTRYLGNIAVLLVLAICTACSATSARVGPNSLQVVASYRPGLSESKPWDAEISGIGEVSKTTYISGNSDETAGRNSFSLLKNDLADLVKTISAAGIFSTRGAVASELDFGHRSLAITIDGVSHKVTMPNVPGISGSPDKLRAFSDFERVWDELFRKAPWLGENRYASTVDSPENILIKMGCLTCHRLPGDPQKHQAALGPVLSMKTIAPRRVDSPDYTAKRAAGKVHATTEKEYVIESILAPRAFTVPGGVQMMPGDYGDKFSYSALNKLADFLLSIDESSAITTEGIFQRRSN